MDTGNTAHIWQLAQQHREKLQFATIFDPRCINKALRSHEAVEDAIKWCRSMGVTRVYLETFRMGRFSEPEVLRQVRDDFSAEGFDVAGGVTTNFLGKTSTGWNMCCCYSDDASRAGLRKAFRQAAEMFDLLMIDDFFFTDCECERCREAKGDRSWTEYRCELMLRVAREDILETVKAVNPDCRVILKFPQWLDILHYRGYDTLRETKIFDYVYMGTEARDQDHEEDLPFTVPWQSYYLMAWLKEHAPEKCLGGWFDAIATSAPTFVEQAVQTVLARPGEIMLFSYSGLRKRERDGENQTEAFRAVLPELFELAELVQHRKPHGLAAPQPHQPEPGNEVAFMPFMGMFGVPLLPSPNLSTDAPGAFASVHAAGDPDMLATLRTMIDDGKPVVATAGLARNFDLDSTPPPNLIVLPETTDPFHYLELPREQLEAIRHTALQPLGLKMEATAEIACWLFGSDLVGLANFTDEPAAIHLDFENHHGLELLLAIPRRAITCQTSQSTLKTTLPGRTFAAFKAH